MTLISGPLSTVTADPTAVSVVQVSVQGPRTSGTGVQTHESKNVAVSGGVFSHEISPGPATLTMIVGQKPGPTIPILVGDVASQTLAEVVDAARLATGETQESLAQFLQQVLGAANDVATAKSAALAEIDGEVQRAIDESAQTTIDTVVVPAIEGARDEALNEADLAIQAAKDANTVPRVTALEAMNGVSPESPVDGQTANLVLQGDTLTGKAIRDVVIDKVNGTVAAPLAPLFLDPIPFGVQSGGPANVRTGLSTQHGPGGGWIEEMSVPVVGDAGATTLTSPDTATVDGFVTQRWQAAVSTGDRDFYVEVVGTAPGGIIHLRDPLPVSVDGYLSARYDTAQDGQHLTRRGTRAYVESLLNISPIFASRGSIITGAWAEQPTELQSLWRKNVALEEAGSYVVTEGGLVSVGNISYNVANSYDSDYLTPTARGTRAHVSAGVGGAGQGLIAELSPAGRAAVLEFNVGCRRSSHAPESFSVNVKVTADGAVILDTLDSGALRNYRIPIAGVGNMTVEVTSTSTTEHYLVVSETTLRTANVDAPRHGRGKIVTLGDSWMAWYDGEFGKALAEKTGAQVVNHSLGGMTTEWGLAWWDECVTSEKPDEVWIHFFTNDLNSLTSNTFVAPDGSTKPLWTVTGAETRKVWRNNIWEMIRRAQSSGIRPVIIMPSATVGPNQTQSHMNASALLETPPLDSSYSATPAEINSIEWVGNRRNKYKGKPLKVGSSTLWATGSQPEDAWADPNSDILMSLQRLALNRSDYVTEATGYRHSTLGDVTEDVVSFDDSGDVPSLTVTWGDGGTAGRAHRIAGDVTVTVGREYLTFAQVAEATSPLTSTLTNVSGSYVPWARAGQGDHRLMREVAGISNATLQVGLQRGDLSSGSQTKIAATLAVIDVGALLRDAPNLESKTDLELVQFALSLK